MALPAIYVRCRVTLVFDIKKGGIEETDRRR
jgi:hypothetical protein